MRSLGRPRSLNSDRVGAASGAPGPSIGGRPRGASHRLDHPQSWPLRPRVPLTWAHSAGPGFPRPDETVRSKVRPRTLCAPGDAQHRSAETHQGRRLEHSLIETRAQRMPSGIRGARPTPAHVMLSGWRGKHHELQSNLFSASRSRPRVRFPGRRRHYGLRLVRRKRDQATHERQRRKYLRGRNYRDPDGQERQHAGGDPRQAPLHASKVATGASTYVVWIRPYNGTIQNAGALQVSDDLLGKFNTTTPHRAFTLMVTPEPSARIVAAHA
jgi:hypothetical protein